MYILYVLIYAQNPLNLGISHFFISHLLLVTNLARSLLTLHSRLQLLWRPLAEVMPLAQKHCATTWTLFWLLTWFCSTLMSWKLWYVQYSIMSHGLAFYILQSFLNLRSIHIYLVQNSIFEFISVRWISSEELDPSTKTLPPDKIVDEKTKISLKV